MRREPNVGSAGKATSRLTSDRIEQWHALRMMIGFCREEAEALGSDFLVYCMDLGVVAADDHMREMEAQNGTARAEALSA